MTRAAALVATAALLSCGAQGSPRSHPHSLRSRDPSPEERYLTDQHFRRAELEASLVSWGNHYAEKRLARYATPEGWDALPEMNLAAEPLRDAPDLRPFAGEPLALPEAALAGDPAALRALGERAFFRYPAQLASYLDYAVASRERAETYGLWSDGEHGVGGLVRVKLGDGSVGLGVTCATCHAAPGADGGLVVGVGNPRLDLGRLLTDESHAVGGWMPERMLTWGPGRADVTTTEGDDPVRIPDLRPVSFLSFLQHDGTVEQKGVVSLAIRIETLLITGHGEAMRPPRVVALGLAEYVRSLAGSLPSGVPVDAEARRGQGVFAARCAGCHAPPSLSGEPVDVALIGTDPTSGRSPDRGTGRYRVPSLRGVGTRERLLHDGSVASLDVLLDPRRVDASFDGGHPIPGHLMGLDLAAEARAELLAYLRGL